MSDTYRFNLQALLQKSYPRRRVRKKAQHIQGGIEKNATHNRGGIFVCRSQSLVSETQRLSRIIPIFRDTNPIIFRHREIDSGIKRRIKVVLSGHQADITRHPVATSKLLATSRLIRQYSQKGGET
jgi:hypothetical protein